MESTEGVVGQSYPVFLARGARPRPPLRRSPSLAERRARGYFKTISGTTVDTYAIFHDGARLFVCSAERNFSVKAREEKSVLRSP